MEKNIDKTNDFLLIIDGSSLLSTQFFGNLPREIVFAKTQEEKERYFHKIMQTSKGIYTNAVYGFLRTLIKILKEQQPKYLAITWDVSRDTFRREIYPEYKAHRSELLLPLSDQFSLCQQVLKSMNVKQFMDERYEADDFSGSLASKFEHNIPVRIMTKDNDYLQLVTENTNLWLIHATAKKTDELYEKYKIDPNQMNVPERTFLFTPDLVKKEFGVWPASVNSLKGLQGDPSDNIKGVPGIGDKTATALIGEYESVDRLYEVIHKAENEGIDQLTEFWKNELGIKRSPIKYLTDSSEDDFVGEHAARISTLLATIKKDIDLSDVTLESLEVDINEKNAAEIFKELEFKSLNLSFAKEKQEKHDSFQLDIINNLPSVEKLINTIKKEAVQKYLGLSFIMEEGSITGTVLTWKSDVTAVIHHEGFITTAFFMQQVASLIEYGINVSVFDLKEKLGILPKKEMDHYFDVTVAAYLIDPLQSDYSCQTLSQNYLGEFLSMGEDSHIYESRIAYLMAVELEKRLKESNMLELFRTIEMPLVETLYDMETRGILINQEDLVAFGKELDIGIARIEKEIYEEVGEEFNLNSPKQLGVILFEKMKLPFGKKTKTGYSTSVDVLEKLKEEAPVVEKILEYRQLAKLKSTYVEGLRQTIQEDGRIHCKFCQTVAATGRLSSTEPNLQNIPIRMELGRKIRKVFIPKEGYLFVDADYSQIELRILAHMSGDESLINAYKQAQDIHRTTASQVFHTPFDEVTPQQRSNAKAVNFGIIYGISSFGLGQGLNISRKEADKYIKQYFDTYPKVKNFLDSLVEFGREHGYVETIYHRRRPIPELSSTNFMQRNFGERCAMNSPIQGTAADIIKIAMIRVNERLKKEKMESRLLLQIHDELLIETKEEEKDKVKEILWDEMFHAASMAVPLEVDVKQGKNWYEAK